MNFSPWLRLVGRLSYLGGQRLEREIQRRNLAGLARQEIQSLQLQRLNTVWEHAHRHVPHYRDMKNHLGLPDGFIDLEEFFSAMPPLEKAALQANPQRFLADNAGPGRWVRTSGSTGRPLATFRGRGVHRQIRLDTHYHRRHWGIEWHHPWLLLWGDEAHFRAGLQGRLLRFRKHLATRLKNRYHVNAYFLNEISLEHCHDLMAKGRIRMIYAYAQAALRLAQFCRDRPPPVGLQLAVISAEYADPKSMDEMAGVFRCPVVREYGANETGIIAADLPGSPLHIMEHRHLVETTKREDGLHEIQITCLDNPDYPLLRYRLEDVTSSPLVIPEHGAARLTDIFGRVNDQVLLPDGKWLHSAYITHAIRAVAAINRFQIIQEGIDHLHLRLETQRPLTPGDKGQIRSRIFSIAPPTLRITITEDEAFEKTPRGKHCFVIRRGGFPAIPHPGIIKNPDSMNPEDSP